MGVSLIVDLLKNILPRLKLMHKNIICNFPYQNANCPLVCKQKLSSLRGSVVTVWIQASYGSQGTLLVCAYTRGTEIEIIKYRN